MIQDKLGWTLKMKNMKNLIQLIVDHHIKRSPKGKADKHLHTAKMKSRQMKIRASVFTVTPIDI